MHIFKFFFFFWQQILISIYFLKHYFNTLQNTPNTDILYNYKIIIIILVKKFFRQIEHFVNKDDLDEVNF